MFAKFTKIVALLILLCFCLSACAKSDQENTYESQEPSSAYLLDSSDQGSAYGDNETALDEEDEEDEDDYGEVTSENFADKYFESMFYLNDNSWSQSDITYLLTKYIKEDLKENGSDSKYAFLRNTETNFFYTVNTETGQLSISFLIRGRGKNVDYPNVEFLSLLMFVTYDGDEFDDLDSYETEVAFEETVTFTNTDSLINYINGPKQGASILFERGWLEL